MRGQAYTEAAVVLMLSASAAVMALSIRDHAAELAPVRWHGLSLYYSASSLMYSAIAMCEVCFESLLLNNCSIAES